VIVDGRREEIRVMGGQETYGRPERKAVTVDRGRGGGVNGVHDVMNLDC